MVSTSKQLTKENLKALQKAVYKDYGIKITDDKLWDAGFNLLSFFATLIEYDIENKKRREI